MFSEYIIKSNIRLTNPQIVVSDKPGDEFAVQHIMRCVDGPNAVVGIVGSAHAEAEWPSGPERSGPPVVVIMTIAVHSLRFAELF